MSVYSPSRSPTPTDCESSTDDGPSRKRSKNVKKKEKKVISDTDSDSDSDDGLLSSELSHAEREEFTKKGIKVCVEYGRSKKDYPQSKVFIKEWSKKGIKVCFNQSLEKFGLDTQHFVPYLVWAEQKRPYAVSWDDLVRLDIPWSNKKFSIFLKELRQSPKRRLSNSNVDGEPKNKKRKLSKKEQKNKERENALEEVKRGLERRYVTFINDKSDSCHFWYRVCHLYQKSGWSFTKIQEWLDESYIGSRSNPRRRMAMVDSSGAQSKTFQNEAKYWRTVHRKDSEVKREQKLVKLEEKDLPSPSNSVERLDNWPASDKENGPAPDALRPSPNSPCFVWNGQDYTRDDIMRILEENDRLKENMGVNGNILEEKDEDK